MFKQIKNVMCRASINGSNEMTMIAIPFENIAAFEENQVAHQWDVILKPGCEIADTTDIHVDGGYYGDDHINQNTIENLCSLKEVEAEE